MTACLCSDSSRPSRSEALIIAVTYGSKTSTISFSRNVGMGSSAHDFVGDCMMNRRTSSSLHGDNTDNDTSAVDEVYARTAFTFSSKNRRKASASLLVGVTASVVRLSRCSNVVNDLQSFVGELPSVMALQGHSRSFLFVSIGVGSLFFANLQYL